MKYFVALFVVAVLLQAAVANGTDDQYKDHPCRQPKYEPKSEHVACFGHIEAWYHDHSVGDCKSYTYDGCNKTPNHFETLKACDDLCTAWHQKHAEHHHHD